MARYLGRGLVLFVVAIAVAGCGGGSSGSHGRGLALKVDTKPFRVSLAVDGKTVVAEDSGARLRYQLANGDQHRLTNVLSNHGDVYVVATDEPGRTAKVSVSRTPYGVSLSVQLRPTTGVQQVYDAFGASTHDHFLGGGESGGPVNYVDLSGQVVAVKVAEPCSYAPVPFFASSAGWGLRLTEQTVGALAFPGSTGGGGCQFGDEPQCTFPVLQSRVEVCERGARLEEELFTGGFSQVLSDYEAVAGRPLVPPSSELALIKWRGRSVFTTSTNVLEDIQRFRAAKIPIGWVLLDDVWQDCMGTLKFDPTRFPDPAGLVRQVHALGVRFMLWVSPKVVCYQGYPKGSLLGTPADETLDLRKPAVVAEFERRLKQLVALGIDGVKGDRGDEVDIESYGEGLQNLYPVLYERDVMGVLPRGSAAIFRAGAMGSQSVAPGLWAGDQSGDFTGLQHAIRSGLSASMSGFSSWGSDIGGYNSGGLTAEVFARWAQFGAVSPVMEVGGSGPNSTPWTLGPDAMTALRDAAVLHYELFPYLYGLLQQGQPVLRPLGYAYPGDEESWNSDLEMLVGPDLLAAPVIDSGTTPSVYLPAGSWVDLYTGATVIGGGQSFTRTTSLTTFPLYARAGAVIPFNLRTARDSWWGVDELTHPGRAGFLATNGATLHLGGQPHDVQIFVPSSSRPHRVTLGGHAVSWTWNAGPLPGVVVRVHGPTVRGGIVLSGA